MRLSQVAPAGTWKPPFQAKHWPTHEEHVYVDFVRHGALGDAAARWGDSRWRRLTEIRAGTAKSVFHFDVPGSVAKSTHAGLPWLLHLRRRLAGRLHFWPFDGWDIPQGRTVVAEVYPSLWSRAYPREGRSSDQHDAYSIAAWMRQADGSGALADFLDPHLSEFERKTAEIEGWILGVAAQTVRPSHRVSNTRAERESGETCARVGLTLPRGLHVFSGASRFRSYLAASRRSLSRRFWPVVHRALGVDAPRMPADHAAESTESVQVVWPTKEQIEKRLAEIERYAPHWKENPALLLIKPELGLIVSLENIEHDERYFTLTLAVEEAIVAPEGFDAQVPIALKCVWNQPYMSLGADSISAAYSFYLHFGAQGVQRVREVSATKRFDKLRNSPDLLVRLRDCFDPYFQRHPDDSRDETG